MIRWSVLLCAVALAAGTNLETPGEILENIHSDMQKHHEPPSRLVDLTEGFQPHVPHNPKENLQNEIINEVLGPVYYDREWILDYRYLPTGGRGWINGPGGQVLILPGKARSHEESFDHLLEVLRKKELHGELAQVYGPGHNQWPTVENPHGLHHHGYGEHHRHHEHGEHHRHHEHGEHHRHHEHGEHHRHHEHGEHHHGPRRHEHERHHHGLREHHLHRDDVLSHKRPVVHGPWRENHFHHNLHEEEEK